ncbi:TonB-dependent receptor [Sphingosinicella rhizophila]|uniref:TonB-dependent receptor n=1 Tax=Sphingosinicella rhizophila TaxID=3050082 RepID=A0ABU3QCH2_9SPHN|nr:TonB-dependent receptor [Sphingosinicella sp. GR2756]MDT9600844.1 TonB-dependent receptor [Sphingosinicella sp. GR2756]
MAGRIATRLILAAGMSLAALSPAIAAAQDRTYSIPAGDLRTALKKFAAQSGTRLIFRTDAVRSFRTSGVSGAHSSDEALQKLLSGTPLEAKRDPSGAVAIVPRADEPQSAVEPVRGAGGPESRAAAETDAEIVVTALKRGPQLLTDTAAAVGVIDGNEIEAAGARSLVDILQQVPSTSITNAGSPGVNTIQIRGVSATFGAASVGFYLDDLPFTFINQNFLPDPSVYDLESVEVLRGPQGSLYGAGASGGVVLVRTRDPDLDDLAGKAEGRVSTTKGGGENFFLGGAVNIPIVEDRIALRVSGDYYDDSGWLERPALNQRDFNDSERLNLRAKLRIAATDRLTLQLQGAISRIDAAGNVFANDRAELGGAVDQSIETDYDQAGAVITYEFPGATLTSTTSYLDFRNAGETSAAVSIPTESFAKNFAQEVRLNSTGSGAFSWLVGGFYNDISAEINQELSGLGLPFNVQENFRAERFSIFGEAAVALFDGVLDLTAGASYFEDDTRSFSAFLGPEIRNAISTKQFSPKLSAAWHPNDNSTLYAVYSQGFRPATLDFTVTTFLAQMVVPSITGRVRTENLTAYEVGYKTDALDGRLHFEGALFYNDIQDTQQSAAVVAPGATVPANTILNVGDAESYGVEWLFLARPTGSLTLNFSGSYTKSRIKRDFFAPGADPATAVPLFRAGQPLNFVPEWLVSAGIRHEHRWGSLQGVAAVSAQYASTRFQTILGQASLPGDENIRVDARYELGRDNWTLFVFAENLTNENNPITPSGFLTSLFPPDGGIVATRHRPRTLGIGARLNF